VKVPTAKLSVAAVDDYGKPIDIYVTEVRLGSYAAELHEAA
jgi:hypothetical protein